MSRLVTDITLVATIFRKCPGVKLAIPFEEIQFSPPTRDIGIVKLPVMLR